MCNKERFQVNAKGHGALRSSKISSQACLRFTISLFTRRGRERKKSTQKTRLSSSSFDLRDLCNFNMAFGNLCIEGT